ncbi:MULTISPECIES: hypothetical protein [Sphingobacterium]|uniref:hypothetical protein n=1 Tax=Sphingobacterium TaxID=28453 RepID=UPI00257DE636|nr:MULTISPECIES: hypothetical protein [Sphingobacterium]
MNKVNFQQPGGFPIKTNTLNFLQTAFGQLSSLAGLGGANYILNGCTVAGGNVTDGTIVIDGEVLPFIGGPKLQYVVIEETIGNDTFKDGLSKPIFTTRIAKMAAAGTLAFDSLSKVTSLTDMKDMIFKQEIAQWSPTFEGIQSGSIVSSDCRYFKMGRFMNLFGNIVFDYPNEGQTLASISIKNLPVFAAPTDQYGFCNVAPSNLDVDIRYVTYVHDQHFLRFNSMFAKGMYNLRFSINIITN